MPTRITTGETTHLTEHELNAMFEAAKPGEIIVYALGHVACELRSERLGDRSAVAKESDPKRKELIKLMKRTWALGELGRACLTQRKQDYNLYEYRITKR